MVTLIRKTNSSYIKEAKQVGDLYHICTLDAFVTYIIPENQLKGSGKYYNTLVGSRDIISFTRNSRFTVPTATVYDNSILFQFKVDGDSLSNKYNVLPYSDIRYTKGEPVRNEDEEVVVGTIINFKSYIKSVKFDVKTLDLLSQKTARSFIVKLNKVKKYLGNIPCTRGNLPYSMLGRIDHAKDGNSFKINTLDDLIAYMKYIEKSNNSEMDVSYIDSEDLFKQYVNSKNPSEDVIQSVLQEHPTWNKYVLGKELISACMSGDTRKIKELINFPNIGKFINMYTDKGSTPLYLLCTHYLDDKSKDILNTIRLLLEHGASTVQLVGDQRDFFRDIHSIIYNVSYFDAPELFSLLLKYTPYIPSDEDGWILYNIVNRGTSEEEKLKLLKPLIKVHAKAKTVNGDENALNLALRINELKIAKLFLENGADPNMELGKHSLVLDLLKHRNDEDIIINTLDILSKYDLGRTIKKYGDKLIVSLLNTRLFVNNTEAMTTILKRLIEQGLDKYATSDVLKKFIIRQILFKNELPADFESNLMKILKIFFDKGCRIEDSENIIQYIEEANGSKRFINLIKKYSI